MIATPPLVIFDVLRSVLEVLLGAAGAEVATPIVAGIAALLVGLHYSRELSALLVSAARIVSIGSVVLFGVGVAVLAGVATGWISIDGGILGDALRLVGELAGFGGSH
jgi:subtilisin family serine protease